MNLSKKLVIGTSIALTICATSMSAANYVVQKGDTLYGIVYKLGFNSVEEAGFSAPSGDINKIFPGDTLGYHAKKKKNKFKSKDKIDLEKFCFKNSRSIHYRAKERCKK